MVVNASGTIYVGWKETDGPEAAGRRVGFSYSTSDGATWAPNILMNQSHGSGQRCSNSDPWMALSPDDQVHYAYLEYNCLNGDSGIDFTSTVDGVNWGPVHFLLGAGGLSDKESIAVAPSGRIYAAWDEAYLNNQIQVSWSNDGGNTWAPFVVPTPTSGLGVIVATSPDGVVYLTWWDLGNDNILFDWSDDGGLTWHSDIRVNDRAGSAQAWGAWQIPIPAMNVDPISGDIYVAWPDSRNNNLDIYMARSTDGGRTWSTNVRVNDDTGTTMQYMVDLAVDRNGTVHAAWEDKRNGNWNIYYANSTDGGGTWSTNLRVSTEDTPGSYNRPGDYFALEAGPSGTIYVVWTDGRGDDFDIYFARNPGFPSATFTVTTDPVGLPVTVDNITETSPVTRTWTIGSSHTVAVAEAIPLGSDARYLWIAWSDGGAPAHTIIAGGDTTLTAYFRKQYRATIAPDPDGLQILVDNITYTTAVEAWWDEGSTHWLEAPSPQFLSSDMRYVWVSWSDGGGRAHAFVAWSPLRATATFLQEQALRVSTSPANLTFTFDGVAYSTSQTFWTAPGSYHTVGVEGLQSGLPGVRYRFSRWSDGGAATHVIRFSGAMLLEALFTSEYYLTIESPVPGTVGEGWYPEGSWVAASVTYPVYATGAGERLAFRGWTGDASGAGWTSDPILMDGPKRAVADYGAQVYLDVSSAYGVVTGTGWYDVGSNAVASVSTSIVDLSPGTRVVFQGWSGDATGTATTSDPIPMVRPKVVVALWALQYYLSVETAHGTASGGGWYEAGSIVVVRLDSAIVSLSPGTRAVFAGWSGDASGTDAGASSGILMDRPKTAVALWRTEYELQVLSAYGTVFGAGWYAAGALAYAGVNASIVGIGAGVRAVFLSWSGEASGSGLLSTAIRMDAPRAATATWKLQYLVRVEDDLGLASGTGWYDAGSLATLQAPASAQSGGQSYVFAGWAGDVTSTERTLTVEVRAPLTVRATWAPTGILGGSAAGLAILLIPVLVVLVVVLAVLIVRRRRRKRF